MEGLRRVESLLNFFNSLIHNFSFVSFYWVPPLPLGACLDKAKTNWTGEEDKRMLMVLGLTLVVVRLILILGSAVWRRRRQ